MSIARRCAMARFLPFLILLSACANLSGIAKQTNPMLSQSEPLAYHAASMAVELAPVHLALRDLYGDNAKVTHGGVVDFVGDDAKPDVASNGEAQTLRNAAAEPDLRIIMTIAEGHYPIIARRSAGIDSVADLKGKRIGNYPYTTGGFFLAKMLAGEGLTIDDVTPVLVPLGEMPDYIRRGNIDATAIWEPDSESALRMLRELGEDVVIFSGEGVYHERYNLNSTTDILSNPVKRREIIRLMRAIMDAVGRINSNPAAAAEAQAMVAKSGGLYSAEEVALCWPNVKFVASFDDELVNVLIEEEPWLAELEGREPRAPKEIAKIIDRSVYDEAIAGR